MRKVYSFCKECGDELETISICGHSMFGCPSCRREIKKEEEITMLEDEMGNKWIEVSK